MILGGGGGENGNMETRKGRQRKGVLVKESGGQSRRARAASGRPSVFPPLLTQRKDRSIRCVDEGRKEGCVSLKHFERDVLLIIDLFFKPFMFEKKEEGKK